MWLKVHHLRGSDKEPFLINSHDIKKAYVDSDGDTCIELKEGNDIYVKESIDTIFNALNAVVNIQFDPRARDILGIQI